MVQSEEIGLVDLLQNIDQSGHTPAIKKACSGALWTIREELKSSTNEKYKELGKYFYHGGGLVVRASALWAGGHGFDLRPRQTKVFKTGSSGFSPWSSGFWE